MRAVQCNRVGGTTPCDEHVSTALCPCEVTGELEHQPVEAVVGDEQVRPETDYSNGEALVSGEPQRPLQLVDGLRACKGRSRPTGPDRREARERDVPLDVHRSNSSSSCAAWSTSPAPTVRMRSPARARRARKCAPSAYAGVHATRMPGRFSVSASRTSSPLTRSSGCSRA